MVSAGHSGILVMLYLWCGCEIAYYQHDKKYETLKYNKIESIELLPNKQFRLNFSDGSYILESDPVHVQVRKPYNSGKVTINAPMESLCACSSVIWVCVCMW